MLLFVKQDEAAYPLNICLLGSQAVVLAAADMPNLVE
jgi:hypothetical protein